MQVTVACIYYYNCL